MTRHFGTDGIRKKAEYFDEEYLKRVAYGINKAGFHRVVIGRDTRESGKIISDGLIRHLNYYGAEVIDVGVTTTPAVAYLVEKTACDGGIVISASHNPPEYNGIKLFDRYGKLSVEREEEIERLFIDPPYGGGEKGRVTPLPCATEWYANYLKSVVHSNYRGLKVSLDLSNGAALLAPDIFRAMGAEVFVHNDEKDGKNINVRCGATHPDAILSAVDIDRAEIGFAYDGDGDRVTCAYNGIIMSGDRILCLLAQGMKERGLLRKNSVVGTVMSNMGTEKYLNNNGISFFRSDVGDRNVAKVMKEVGATLGGEDSGHIILSDLLPTGDGILTSLVVSSLIVEGETFPDFPLYPTATEEVYADEGKKRAFFAKEEISRYLKSIEDFRVVVRPSGTENKIRILVEGEEVERVKGVAREIKDYLEREL